MSDDLRTKIAAVLYAMDCDDYDIQAGEELDPSVFWAIREGAERRADAVIAELGLEREDGECGYCHAQLPGCRYVTEWTADHGRRGDRRVRSATGRRRVRLLPRPTSWLPPRHRMGNRHTQRIITPLSFGCGSVLFRRCAMPTASHNPRAPTAGGSLIPGEKPVTPILMFQAATLATLAFLIYTQTRIERTVMSLQDVVDNLTSELAVAYGEIVAEIAQLKAQVEAAGVAEQVDFTALQKAADALDNIVAEPTEPEGDELELTKRDDTSDK